MDYQTFKPHPDLASLVSCYWTLKVPSSPTPNRQRIIPDGCIEMAFILGDDIKRYTVGDDYILQPRAMVLGQILEPFYIEPNGHVDTFAIRFYPFGFANFINTPIADLANKETALADLFGDQVSKDIEQKIIHAQGSIERIKVIESFLLDKLKDEEVIHTIVQQTIDALFSSKGGASISEILKEDLSKRRQLERNFKKQIGISPKQLGKVIRLQSALKMILNKELAKLTDIAYESEYYDQAHFIKDFKEFTGVSPATFIGHDKMALSSLFYR